jgi:putative hydrolase of the HAD superfamily
VTVEHVLLDADGVLQRSAPDPVGLLSAWAGERAEELAHALWRAERGPLRGEGDFVEALERIVPAYADVAPGELYDALWRDIAVSEESLALAGRLRAAGLGVHLGTNQHRQRAELMRSELGYDEHFDVSCYSWELGTKKPEPAYFEIAVERIGAAPAQVLFVDDVAANVEAARAVGLRAVHWHLDEGHDVLLEALAGHGLPLGEAGAA